MRKLKYYVAVTLDNYGTHGKYFYDSTKLSIHKLSHSIVSALCGKPAT
jgi:hypothetical protein